MSESVKKLLFGKSQLEKGGAVSTGSTLLNLACTDKPHMGFMKGAYYLVAGDSTSGKTWLALTCLAEACRSKAFDDYRLIHDDVEEGALMDIGHYFGKKAAARIEPPARKDGLPVYSDTVESFYYNVSNCINDGRPFLYVLDSQDALDSDAAAEKFSKRKKAHETGNEAAGSYGDGKAKYHSEHLRHVLSGIKRTRSILVIIGQTRDNLGFGFEKRIRSGGRALRFYARLEIWTSVLGKIKKTIRGKPRTVGVRCLAEVRKNRVTGKVGKDRSVVIPIYYGLGIDDVGSCVDYLVAEKKWKKSKGIYHAPELEFEGSRDKLIHHIEDKGLEIQVRKLAGELWREIETECLPDRKKRYE